MDEDTKEVYSEGGIGEMASYWMWGVEKMMSKINWSPDDGDAEGTSEEAFI